MTGPYFSAVIVPTSAEKKDADYIIRVPWRCAWFEAHHAKARYHRDPVQQASGGMLASCAHSMGRPTKYHAAEAVAGRRGIPGSVSKLSGAGFYASCEALYPRPSCILVQSQIYPACLDNPRP